MKKVVLCIQRTRKSRTSNLRNISRTHYAKRSKASSNYRPWVEIKAFGNVQELLNVDNIANVLPTIIDRQCKSVELFKHIQELVKVLIYAAVKLVFQRRNSEVPLIFSLFPQHALCFRYFSKCPWLSTLKRERKGEEELTT